MRGGVTLLRDTLDSFHSPANLPITLSSPAVQTILRSARLTRMEWNCLYPSPGVYGKSTDFDITLTFRLLRTICNLTPPATGWDDLPNTTDQSLEADLARVKYYRNEAYGHSKTLEIPDDRFVALWREISEALLRIAANISHEKKEEWKKSIDSFLRDPLTPDEERCVEELRQWYKHDMDVKDAVEKLARILQEDRGFREENDKRAVEKLDAFKQAKEELQQELRGLREVTRQLQQSVGKRKNFYMCFCFLAYFHSAGRKFEVSVGNRKFSAVVIGEVCSFLSNRKTRVLTSLACMTMRRRQNAPREKQNFR